MSSKSFYVAPNKLHEFLENTSSDGQPIILQHLPADAEEFEQFHNWEDDDRYFKVTVTDQYDDEELLEYTVENTAPLHPEDRFSIFKPRAVFTVTVEELVELSNSVFGEVSTLDRTFKRCAIPIIHKVGDSTVTDPLVVSSTSIHNFLYEEVFYTLDQLQLHKNIEIFIQKVKDMLDRLHKDRYIVSGIYIVI